SDLNERFAFMKDEPIPAVASVPSPLEEQWNRFSTTRPWVDDTLELIDDITERCEKFPELSWFRPRAKAIDDAMSDLVVAGQIRSLLDQRFFTTLDTIERASGSATGEMDGGAIAALRRLGRRLLDRVAAPQFNRMLLVFGSHGSGKTFFVRTR